MIASLVIGTASLIMGLISKYSNLGRNSLFGYRTYLSMKNDANWEFANRKFANHAILIGIAALIIGGLSSILSIKNGYSVFIILTLLLASIITIEVNLRKFDRSHQ